MSTNNARPKTCKIAGCTRGVCAANIDLCHDHYMEARALAETEGRAPWTMHPLPPRAERANENARAE